MLKQTDVDMEQLDPTKAIVQSDGSVHALAFCTQRIFPGSFYVLWLAIKAERIAADLSLHHDLQPAQTLR